VCARAPREKGITTLDCLIYCYGYLPYHKHNDSIWSFTCHYANSWSDIHETFTLGLALNPEYMQPIRKNKKHIDVVVTK